MTAALAIVRHAILKTLRHTVLAALHLELPLLLRTRDRSKPVLIGHTGQAKLLLRARPPSVADGTTAQR